MAYSLIDLHGNSNLKIKANLFLISFLILFLELACIRWFPAHVLYLSYFTNIVLLSCFIGMSVGCLTAKRPQNFLLWSPVGLLINMGIAHWIARDSGKIIKETVNVANNYSSPEIVFFGSEFLRANSAPLIIPFELILVIFFISIAMVMLGLGQEMGRAFNKIENRVIAYIVNISGSIVGIVLFTIFSWFEFNPFWWFTIIAMGLAFLIFSKKLIKPGKILLLEMVLVLIFIPYISALRSGTIIEQENKHEFFWSPYYLVQHFVNQKAINVNLMGHQWMLGLQNERPEAFKYSFPHMLQRHSYGKAFEEVLIIGSGAGNDVSRALQWGAESVDAVEIDPIILRIGHRSHPDNPYNDRRTSAHLNDGRIFLKNTEKKYDLIIYALVDSLVLHSTKSNIRLESFLFTEEAFIDVSKRLKKNGVFVIYNFFRQGWIVARIYKILSEVFNSEPIVFSFPHQEVIEPDSKGGFTIFIAGSTNHIKNSFRRWSNYKVSTTVPPRPDSDNGFMIASDQQASISLKPASVVIPPNLKITTDNWPFLYLRNPMIPKLNLNGIILMGFASLIMIFLFMPKSGNTKQKIIFNGRMFFLGAGFMLIETKAVVQMSLLLGSTWLVNSLVFLTILLMIFIANIFVLKLFPKKLGLYYFLLFFLLFINWLIPLNSFLGLDGLTRLVGSCLLVFSPMIVAGIIFAACFGQSTQPDADFGFNIAGAMAGGLAEYSSTLLGFQNLALITLFFYILSFVFSKTTKLSTRS